jgi:NhaP-type Na+/H+ or K+/H+ antiporter
VTILIALSTVLVGWALVSRRLERFSVTVPIALVLAGAVLGGGAAPLVPIDLSAETLRELVELTLAVLLFADATEISALWLRRSGGPDARLLAIGLPLTVAAGFAAGLVVFPGRDPWLIALLAATVAATDAALAAGVIADERVPGQLRRIINVESGLNDGLATPLVLLFLAAAAAEGGGEPVGTPLLDTLADLGIALLVGVGLGWAGARLLAAARMAEWSRPVGERVGVLGLAVLAYAVSVELGGNGFVAAFVAGVAAGSSGRDLPEPSLELTRDVGLLLNSVVWFIFGSLVPETLAGGITPGVVAYAVLALTAVRMVPVAAALLGTGLSPRDVLFLGWIGPRGLATIIFGLIAIEDLRADEADLVTQVVVVTVMLSVLAHGLTAGPIAARWPRRREDAPDTAAGARSGVEP